MTERNDIFVKHIERHLIEQKMYGAKVICKICGRDIDQIYNDYLRAMGRYKTKKQRARELLEENKQLKETVDVLKEMLKKSDDTNRVPECDEK